MADEFEDEDETEGAGAGADSPAQEPAGAELVERRLSFEFSGDAREYFRVWIVNLCLTLLTFGVFSAWAKVRKKRYLYAHTLLDGSPFQYLGKPIPILKGRVVALVFVAIWYVVKNVDGQFLGLVTLLGAAMAPWVVVRSAAFNARYTAYRNMTFRFSGTYGSLLSALAKDFFVMLISCGFGYAWLRASFNRFMVSRTWFGGVHGELEREGKHFLPFYLISGFGLAVFVIGAGYFAGIWNPNNGHLIAKSLQRFSALTYAAYFVSFIYLKARITNLLWNGTRLGGLRFESSLSFRQLLWIYVSNTAAIAGSLGLLTPWAVMRVAKYRAAHFRVWASRSLEEFEGSDIATVRAAGAELGELFDLDVAL